MSKLLCITAHPDDESAAFGGALFLSQGRGIQTSVVCMTAGTAARNRGAARSLEELGELRRAEFAAACKVLNVSYGEVLDHPDGRLDRVELHPAVGDLVRCIRQIRPHVVITFGPEGGLTGHIDHAMAGGLATLAFQWAGRADRYPEQLELGLSPHRAQKLYFQTADYLLPERQPVALPTITARLDIGEEGFNKKMEAFQQHLTQAPLFDRVRAILSQGEGFFELYHLSSTREPREAKVESDLFEGVTRD